MLLHTLVLIRVFFRPLPASPHSPTESHLLLPNLFLNEVVNIITHAWWSGQNPKSSFKIWYSHIKHSPTKHSEPWNSNKRIHFSEMVLCYFRNCWLLYFLKIYFLEFLPVVYVFNLSCLPLLLFSILSSLELYLFHSTCLLPSLTRGKMKKPVSL